jgi:hypothetical protein
MNLTGFVGQSTFCANAGSAASAASAATATWRKMIDVMALLLEQIPA